MDESDYEVIMTARIENTTLDAINKRMENCEEEFDTSDKPKHTQRVPAMTGKPRAIKVK